jgi:hypothetical protein
LRYRGDKNVHGKIDTQDGKSWETVILGDFATLRKAGLTRPLMSEIEKTFSAPE